MGIRWTQDSSVRCFRTEPICLSSSVGTFAGIQISVNGIEAGCFCRDGALDLRRMCLGLKCQSTAMQKKVGYLRHLLRLVRNIDITSKYHGLDLGCLGDPLDGFNVVQDANAL